jgi:hypothetical protein
VTEYAFDLHAFFAWMEWLMIVGLLVVAGMAVRNVRMDEVVEAAWSSRRGGDGSEEFLRKYFVSYNRFFFVASLIHKPHPSRN